MRAGYIYQIASFQFQGQPVDADPFDSRLTRFSLNETSVAAAGTTAAHCRHP